jgi:hypothetical protein
MATQKEGPTPQIVEVPSFNGDTYESFMAILSFE